MAGKASEVAMSDLHGLVAEVLLAQLREDPSPGALKAAIDFLHKNGIVADLGDSRNTRLKEIQEVVAEEAKRDSVEEPEETFESLRSRFKVVG